VEVPHQAEGLRRGFGGGFEEAAELHETPPRPLGPHPQGALQPLEGHGALEGGGAEGAVLVVDEVDALADAPTVGQDEVPAQGRGLAVEDGGMPGLDGAGLPEEFPNPGGGDIEEEGHENAVHGGSRGERGARPRSGFATAG